MVLDELKMRTDDIALETDHIVFLLNKYRTAYIKQKYGGQVKKNIPLPYYQILSIAMNPTTKVSDKTIPELVDLNGIELSTNLDAVNTQNTYKITLVQPQRFEYVGINKHLSTILYATIWYDKKFKVKYPGHIPSIFNLIGILENPLDIIKFSADELVNAMNPLDLVFPMEEAAIGEVLAYTLKEVADIRIFPFVDKNNAKDDDIPNENNRTRQRTS
jgi:hypothetical protein